MCRKHGGGTPQARAAAKRRLAEQEAQRLVQAYGLRRDIEPGEALLEEIQWTAGHVLWLRQVVQAIPQGELTWGVAEEAEKSATEFPGTDTVRKAAPSVWLQLYRDERKHLAAICTDALRLGIDERRVRLAERQGELIADVIRRLLEDPELGLDQRQREVGRTVASRHLRVLSGAA